MNSLKLSVQCSAWQKKAKRRRTNSRTNCQQNSNTVCQSDTGQRQQLGESPHRNWRGATASQMLLLNHIFRMEGRQVALCRQYSTQ
jgi:hypothetical protein